MEGKAMVRTGGIRVGTVAVAAMVASCGTPAPHSTTSPTPHSTTPPRPSAAAGPCASVTTTTPIAQVPAACAALWAPYGVTKVPPANLTDATPAPPPVTNATRGAVSDADAQAWALAVNRTGMWLRWSEANDQYALTTYLEARQVVNATLDQAMRRGTSVIDPDCDLFATQYRLFPLTTEGSAFFTSFGQATHDSYVFVERYPGPCAILGKDAAGSTHTLLSTPNSVVSLSAGTVRHDPLLGDIWFGDGAAFCTNSGAPTAWCSA